MPARVKIPEWAHLKCGRDVAICQRCSREFTVLSNFAQHYNAAHNPDKDRYPAMWINHLIVEERGDDAD